MQINKIQACLDFDLSQLKDILIGLKDAPFAPSEKGQKALFLFKAELLNASDEHKYGFTPDCLITFFLNQSEELVVYSQTANGPTQSATIEQLPAGSFNTLYHFSQLIVQVCEKQALSTTDSMCAQFTLLGELFSNKNLFRALRKCSAARQDRVMMEIVRSKFMTGKHITLSGIENSVVAVQHYC